MRDQAPARGRPRSERSRRAILDAAAKLLTERGYAGITIEGVAAEAGVGKTTIYRWWSTKADIYVDLYSELALKIVPPPNTGDYRRDLVILVQGAFRLYRQTAAGLALAGIVAEAQSNAIVSNMVRTEFAPSRRQVIMTILEHGVKRGEISADVDLAILCELIAAAVWFSLLVGNRPLTPRHAEQLVHSIIAGVPRGASVAKSSARTARRRITPRIGAATA